VERRFLVAEMDLLWKLGHFGANVGGA